MVIELFFVFLQKQQDYYKTIRLQQATRLLKKHEDN